MHWTVKGFIAFVICWIVVVNMYVMATRSADVLEQAEREGFDIPWQITAPLYIGAAVGIVADAAFNISAGTVIFEEIPPILGGIELLFSARANRHLHSSGDQLERAVKWCEILDRFDEGHCDDLAAYKESLIPPTEPELIQ